LSSSPSKKKSGRSDNNDDAAAAAASTSNGNRANPFLNANESSMFRHLPNLKIKPLVSATPTAQLRGPTDTLLSASHGDLASACSVSTYPHIPVRSQLPIIDRHLVVVTMLFHCAAAAFIVWFCNFFAQGEDRRSGDPICDQVLSFLVFSFSPSL
jgi:hypothetical protein